MKTAAALLKVPYSTNVLPGLPQTLSNTHGCWANQDLPFPHKCTKKTLFSVSSACFRPAGHILVTPAEMHHCRNRHQIWVGSPTLGDRPWILQTGSSLSPPVRMCLISYGEHMHGPRLICCAPSLDLDLTSFHTRSSGGGLSGSSGFTNSLRLDVSRWKSLQ